MENISASTREFHHADSGNLREVEGIKINRCLRCLTLSHDSCKIIDEISIQNHLRFQWPPSSSFRSQVTGRTCVTMDTTQSQAPNGCGAFQCKQQMWQRVHDRGMVTRLSTLIACQAKNSIRTTWTGRQHSLGRDVIQKKGTWRTSGSSSSKVSNRGSRL